MLKHTGNIFLFIFLSIITSYLSMAQTGPLEIWQIQGNTAISPYAGQQVITAPSVVTAVGSQFLFLQTPDDRADDDPLTSNGIYVATNQAGNRQVGDLIQVSGTVFENEQQTQIGQGSVQVTLISSGNTLPTPVTLDADYPSGVARMVPELEAVEGMQVQFSGMASGPSDYRSMVPVVAGSERPFREPGIEYPGLPDLPVWDGNPEVFWMLPNGLGAASNRFIVAGTPVEASGAMVQTDGEYILFPDNYQLGDSPAPRAVRPPESDEITLASLNVRRFEEENDDFSQKARKIALYIREMLHAPDLLALQEVGSASALSTLRFFLQQQDAYLDYTPFFLAGNGDIHVAYLAKNGRFTNIQLEQLGKLETMPGGGILFDRPPLQFTAELTNQPEISLKVLNIHLRSLLGVEGSNENFVREKRYRQAVALAELVQERQEENLILVGDFNAFPFTDGYVDVFHQISGGTGLGAEYPLQSIVSPPLRDLAQLLPAAERYSYVYRGSAQQIDHALSTSLNGLEVTGMAFARANADYPDAFAPNEQIVQRSSDHDSFVIYLRAGQPNALRTPLWEERIHVFPNPATVGKTLFLELPATVCAHIRVMAPNGQTVAQTTKQKGSRNVTISVNQPGHYQLLIQTEKWFRSEKVVVLPGN